jgi:putative Mg2+ transporter-C (MgtC) family protein
MWDALAAEFSDLPDAAQATRLVVRLLVAGLMGALIGYDRERVASPAGLRTHILVALGAALFVIVPSQADFPPTTSAAWCRGSSRASVFLGAGAILKQDEPTVRGLTTAASIWLTAAIGMAAGLGQLVTALVATVFGLVVLNVHAKVDKRPLTTTAAGLEGAGGVLPGTRTRSGHKRPGLRAAHSERCEPDRPPATRRASRLHSSTRARRRRPSHRAAQRLLGGHRRLHRGGERARVANPRRCATRGRQSSPAIASARRGAPDRRRTGW